MLDKTGFTTSVSEIPKVLMETDFEFSTGLSDIYFIACGTRYLIDPATLLFAFCAVLSCFKKFTYCIVCTDIGNLETFRNGSCIFPSVSEFCSLYFLTVFFVFLFTMQFFAIEVSNPVLRNICCIILFCFSNFSEDNSYVFILL